MSKLVKLLGILLVISLLALPLVACAKQPLTLTVWPMDGATVDETPVGVRGYVSDRKATVWVNDTIVTVSKEGYYSTNLELTEGENIITVVATLGEETITKTVTVTYTPSK